MAHTPGAVFISFAARDGAMAIEFVWVLREMGVPVFCAAEDIRAGDDWNESIREALLACREVVLLLSPESIQSDWVLMELGAAWVLRKHITPVLLYGNPADLPEHVRRIQYQTMHSVGGWEELRQGILQRHKQAIAGAPAVQNPPAIALPIEASGQLRWDDTAHIPINKNPPATVSYFWSDWVQCPNCRKTFSARNQNSWDGEKHKTCGQRLIIEGTPDYSVERTT